MLTLLLSPAMICQVNWGLSCSIETRSIAEVLNKVHQQLAYKTKKESKHILLLFPGQIFQQSHGKMVDLFVK